jgi:hypothetical protein
MVHACMHGRPRSICVHASRHACSSKRTTCEDVAGSSLPKSDSIKHRVLCFLWLGWKILSKTKSQTLLLLGYLRPVFLCARDRWRAGASGTDAVRELCSGCTAIWFLGSIHATAYFYDDDDVSQLSATTTLLRRRHGRSVEFIHRRCWVSVPISSIYLLVLFSAGSSICRCRCSSKFVQICMFGMCYIQIINLCIKLSKFLTRWCWSEAIHGVRGGLQLDRFTGSVRRTAGSTRTIPISKCSKSANLAPLLHHKSTIRCDTIPCVPLNGETLDIIRSTRVQYRTCYTINPNSTVDQNMRALTLRLHKVPKPCNFWWYEVEKSKE